MLLDFLFPNRCLHCNKIIDKNEVICELCLDKVNFSHHQYYENNAIKEHAKIRIPIENAFALMYFQDESLVQKIIHQLKYHHREKIGKTLAQWTIERIEFNQNKPDLIVTIPIHSKKLKLRGYNQLHLFANELSENYNIPVNHNLLKRTVHMQAQATRNKDQRLKNTKNVFQLTENIQNMHILLIDDVYTTGKTLSNAVWEILNKSKDVKISILVMAMDI